MTMPASGYVDQRFNLRPPVLAVCFGFGVFMGFYLHALRIGAAPAESPTVQPTPPAPTVAVTPEPFSTEPGWPGGVGSADPAELEANPNRPTVAQIDDATTPEVAVDPVAPAEIDLFTMVPPEPAVALSPQVGLTGRNATPPGSGGSASAFPVSLPTGSDSGRRAPEGIGRSALERLAPP